MTIVTGFVYLLKCQTFYKVGFAKNVNNRIEGLQSANPFDITLVDSFESDNPAADERNIHKHLKAYRLHGEWFNIPSSVISNRKSWFKPTESLTNPKIFEESEYVKRLKEYNKLTRVFENNIPATAEALFSIDKLRSHAAMELLLSSSYSNRMVEYAIETEDDFLCNFLYSRLCNTDFRLIGYSPYSGIDFKEVKKLVSSGHGFVNALNLYISKHIEHLAGLNYYVWLWCKKNNEYRDFKQIMLNVESLIITKIWGVDIEQLAKVLNCETSSVISNLDAESYLRYNRAEIAVKETIIYDRLDLFDAISQTPLRRNKSLPFISEDNIKPVDAVPLANLRAKPLPTRQA